MTTLAQDDRSIHSTPDDAQFGVWQAIQRFMQGWQQRRVSAGNRRRAALADRQFWNAALNDSRLMADLTRAQQDQPGEVRKRRMLRTF